VVIRDNRGGLERLKRGDSFTEDKNPKFSVCRAVSEGKS
jgi:hypothetical protein